MAVFEFDASNHFIKSKTAAVIDLTPVRSVDSGTGAKRAECNDGNGGPPSLLAFTFTGSTAPSENVTDGIF